MAFKNTYPAFVRDNIFISSQEKKENSMQHEILLNLKYFVIHSLTHSNMAKHAAGYK
jgi:hypothetical protein